MSRNYPAGLNNIKQSTLEVVNLRDSSEIDPFIELLHEASHSHKNNRAAHNATQEERSPSNDNIYTRTHQQSGAVTLNTRITIRNIG